MSIKYINRIGQKHYLHVGETKTGKPKYYFSMNAAGRLAESVAPGFEIYENPGWAKNRTLNSSEHVQADQESAAE